ncbi:ribosomal protein S18-alanine N-acetyltransferase [uncultured Veillonella sp.]|uniref:ribosomal protein S18-alanine N-acetyltransferase n=1 Tax=uncultured Veillonella sp. TaxID=159268 RepID=UPI0028DBDAB6|nr:ribosomal protein S18-alanine N-acetyltransferase [uncultured Veillonella sp.]
MEIRLATIDDGHAIYEIEQQSFSVPWSLESVLAELEGSSNKLYMVICEGNHIVGYAGAWLVYDEGQITNIAILPSVRGKGYGSKLTKQLIDECFSRGMHEIFLEVRTSNLAALAMYRNLGFSVKGIRKEYYSEPTEDAYIMSLVSEEIE